MSGRVMGRPSLLDNKKELIDRIMDYIENHLEVGDVVPSIAGLACELMVTRETVYKWARDDNDISDTLAILNQRQERLLTSGGLSSTMNPTITKLMLANHGYSEKQDINHQSSDGSMTPRSFSREDYENAKKSLSDNMQGLD